MIGAHLLKHWSVTRSVVKPSSAEAEFGGITDGASTSLGLPSLAKELDFKFGLTLQTNSTAAVGICRRRGLGKIRHLATADLWVQDRIRSGDFSLVKVLGANNVADILTKFVDRCTLAKHMQNLGLQQRDGRPALAPHISLTS